MDILKILNESGNDLYLDDLDFFETELSTGEGYDDGYKAACESRIAEIRRWKTGGYDDVDDANPEDNPERKREKKNDKTLVGMERDYSEILPEGQSLNLKPEEEVAKEVRSMRKSREYKKLFKNYVKRKDIIDAAFIDKNFSLFDPWEIDAIASVKQLGEEFLEKYFGAISAEKISRYQVFSEEFFIKHYSQLDAELVLTKGKNEWKEKDKRSKQLDVFLRLKGVKK